MINLEIEKKFLLKNEDWKNNISESNLFLQTYTEDGRIRLIPSLKKAFLTKKTSKESDTPGVLIRIEDEIEIDYLVAFERFKKQNVFIAKRRNFVNFNNFIFEIDEFLNLQYNFLNLVLLEVELNKENIDEFMSLKLPNYVGEDVSNRSEFENYNLSFFINKEKKLEDFI